MVFTLRGRDLARRPSQVYYIFQVPRWQSTVQKTPAEEPSKTRRQRKNVTYVRTVPRYRRDDVRTAPAALQEALTWSLSKDRKFDESVDLSLTLSVDPKKPQQQVRTSVVLPHTTKKKTTIAVFLEDDDVSEWSLALKDAGASVVGGSDLIDEVARGDIPFDFVTASTKILPTLSKKLGKILGPRGLMPHAKKLPHSVGTDLSELVDNVTRLSKAPVVLKTEPRFGLLHCPVGRVSLGYDFLLDNLRDILIALQAAKPEKAPKGRLIKGATLSSTMGPGIRLDVTIPVS